VVVRLTGKEMVLWAWSTYQMGNLGPHLVLVTHCRGKGNIVPSDLIDCNCSNPNVDLPSNYQDERSNIFYKVPLC
jgi:hypothetical protein